MVDRQNNFGPFCEDLLVNILIKLPARNLLKCKCVSKEWHRIVSHYCVPRLSAVAPVSGVYFRVAKDDEMPFVTTFSPQETKDRLHHLVAYRDSVHFVATAALTPRVVCHWRNCCIKVACSPEMSLANLLPFDHRGPDFIDCCNGLVLFAQRPKPQFFVCNPTIRQCVPLPLPPPSIQLPSLYASLAFDPCESIEYRVVIWNLTRFPQCLHVFDSQTGDWKTHEVQVELPTCANSFKLVRYSVYLKNTVYRLSIFSKILCIDLETMKVYVLDCPSQISPPTNQRDVHDQPPPGCIGVSDGFLCYVTDEDGYMYVWLRDHPINKSCEWTLKHKICISYLWKNVAKKCVYGFIVWLRYCGFHPTSDILFLGSSSAILMYYIGSGHLEVVRYLRVREINCGYFFAMFLHKNIFVTLKNWCRGITADIENYEDIQDRWCYFEQ